MVDQQLFRQFTLREVRITEKELGRGSYAAVLELEYQGLKCAGKKLHAVLYEAGISYAAQRYLEECQLLSQTRHPNIVQFLGVCFERGSQFPILVMEFLPINLTSCLEHYGILPDEISYSILHDVSVGLAYLHGQTPAITHRDLSANNVLLSTNMTAKISDLGVAKILNLRPHEVKRMTGTPGTPAYMPPEVKVSNPYYDTSMDVFSFGILVIHTLTAEWPLPTETEQPKYLVQKIAKDHPLIDVISSCIEDSPQQRPKAMEIIQRLRDLVLQNPPSFKNRVEMLQHISTLSIELEKKQRKAQESSGDTKELIEMNRKLAEENKGTLERIRLTHSVQMEQLMLKNEDLRKEVYETQTVAEEYKTQLKHLEQRLVVANDEITRKESRLSQLGGRMSLLTAQVSQLSFQLREEMKSKETVVSTSEATITSMESRLLNKEAIVQSLDAQLRKIQNYLASTQQAKLSFSQYANTPVKMAAGGAVIVNDNIYYGGGMCSSKEEEHYIYCCDLSQDEWTTLPRLSMCCFGLGVVNNELVTVGGIEKGVRTPNILMLEEQTWKKIRIPPMSIARSSPAVVSISTHVIVAGGMSQNASIGTVKVKPTSIVEILNTTTLEWSRTADLPYACSHPSGAICNDTLFMLGGSDGTNRLRSVVTAQIDKLISNCSCVPGNELYTDTRTSVWKQCTNTPSFKPSAVAVSDILFAVGGVDSADRDEYTPTQGVHAYSQALDSWVRVSDLPVPMAFSVTALWSPTVFMVIGGEDLHKRKLSIFHRAKLNILLQ